MNLAPPVCERGEPWRLRLIRETGTIVPIDEVSIWRLARLVDNVFDADLVIVHGACERLNARRDAELLHRVAHRVVNGVLAQTENEPDIEIAFAASHVFDALAFAWGQARTPWRIPHQQAMRCIVRV